MSLAASSMGFAHSHFGHRPFGHGPWTSFVATPTFVFDEEFSVPVAITRFETLDEQRLLLSSERGLTLGYEFSATDSATIGAVTSFFIAAGGPATRFRFVDHRTGIPYIGRFGDQTLLNIRNPAITRNLPRFPLKVNRYVTYGEEITADAPIAWYRLGEAAGATEWLDATGNLNTGNLYGSPSPASGIPGLLTNDLNGATSFTGGGILPDGPPGDPSGTNSFSWEAIIQPSNVSGTIQFVIARADATGLNGASLRWRNSRVQFVRADASTADTIQSAPYPVGSILHIIGTYDGVTMRLYVNSILVGSGPSSRSLSPGAFPTTLGVSSVPDQPFLGILDECVFYQGIALSPVRILRHYQAMTRP